MAPTEQSSSGSQAFSAVSAPKENKLFLSWYGTRLGQFAIAGDHIRWIEYADPAFECLFPRRREDGAPNFLINMDPSNPVFGLIKNDTTAKYIEGGLRFLSNMTISPNSPFDKPTGIDTLLTNFKEHIHNGTFIGHYKGVLPQRLDETFEGDISRFWTLNYMPRFSGKEIKIPATLDKNAFLKPALNTPFTHFVKFPIGEHREGWGVNEWIGLELSDHIGLKTAQHALLPLSYGLPPALMVERFDIPKSPSDSSKWLLIKDFCNLEGISAQDAFSGSMEKIGKLVKQYSTEPEQDLETLYKRTILSWAIKDNDMHRKNISMLFEYDPEQKGLTRVSMAPTYDVTSEIHQNDRSQEMCLTIQGKKSSLNKKSFIRWGEALGFTAEDAERILIETTSSIAERAVDIAQNLPDAAADHESCVYTAQRIATLAVKSAQTIGAPVPDWSPVERVPIANGAIANQAKAQTRRNKKEKHRFDYL